jgi:hypothetical protein
MDMGATVDGRPADRHTGGGPAVSAPLDSLPAVDGATRVGLALSGGTVRGQGVFGSFCGRGPCLPPRRYRPPMGAWRAGGVAGFRVWV